MQSQMTEATRKCLEQQLADVEISDGENPAFIFSLTSVDLLLAMANGLIDPMYRVRKELANRGLDENGRWVGFDRSRQIWEGK